MTLHLIRLDHQSIFSQLELEEALLRADTRNFCIINTGSPKRSIVLGISGDLDTLVYEEKARKDNIPLIRRFSGGGTVIVDDQTLFITFIFEKKDLAVHPYPEPILRWMATLYQEAWAIPEFSLQENDFAIGDKKCAGNAQYIQKDRWLHHTSFLWDYSEKNMGYLRHPPKKPAYRQDRPHEDFLCRLKSFAPSREALVDKLLAHLSKRFKLVELNPAQIERQPHRKSLKLL